MGKKERLSNFELLRILSMIAIVGHHYGLHGVINTTTNNASTFLQGTELNRSIVSFLVANGKYPIGLFFMMTGYFLINHNKSSIKKVLLECIYYGLLLALCAVVFMFIPYTNTLYGGKNALLQQGIMSILTSVTNGWWFTTTYIVLILIIPLLNKAVTHLNKSGLKAMIFVFYLLMCIDFYYVGSYVNIEMGICFYLFGGYLRLYSNKLTLKRRMQYIIIIIGLIVLSTFLMYHSYILNSDPKAVYSGFNRIVLANYWNYLYYPFFQPILCYFVFKVFESIHIKSRIINNISKTVFGVYLIHDSNLLRNLIWGQIFKVSSVQFFSKNMCLYAIGTILMIFVVCSLIDSIRILLFEKKMENAYDGICNYCSKKFVKE